MRDVLYVAMMALQLGLLLAELWNRDLWRAAYWFAAFAITLSVMNME